MNRALIVLAVAALTAQTVSGDSAMANERHSQLRGGAKDTANESSQDARGFTFDDLGSDVTLHLISSSMGAEGALGKSHVDGKSSGKTPCSDDDSDDPQQSDPYSPEPTPTPTPSEIPLLGNSDVAGHALTKTSAPEVPTDSDDCVDPQQSDTYSPEPTVATATPSLGDSNVAGHAITKTPEIPTDSDTSNDAVKQSSY